jgi:hypothetical protein
MSSSCFVSQSATEEILLRVTNMCGECYSDILVDDIIHYDMQSYRYLCTSCQETLCEQMNEECDVIEEAGGLFL